jgi:hypothetical protein
MSNSCGIAQDLSRPPPVYLGGYPTAGGYPPATHVAPGVRTVEDDDYEEKVTDKHQCLVVVAKVDLITAV